MDIILLVVKNLDTCMYDVVTVNSKSNTILEVICSCKRKVNAEWIVELLKKEKL